MRSTVKHCTCEQGRRCITCCWLVLQALNRDCDWLYCSDEGGIKRIELATGVVSNWAGGQLVSALLVTNTLWNDCTQVTAIHMVCALY